MNKIWAVSLRNLGNEQNSAPHQVWCVLMKQVTDRAQRKHYSELHVFYELYSLYFFQVSYVIGGENNA
jgi:hypothetical protein